MAETGPLKQCTFNQRGVETPFCLISNLQVHFGWHAVQRAGGRSMAPMVQPSPGGPIAVMDGARPASLLRRPVIIPPSAGYPDGCRAALSWESRRWAGRPVSGATHGPSDPLGARQLDLPKPVEDDGAQGNGWPRKLLGESHPRSGRRGGGPQIGFRIHRGARLVGGTGRTGRPGLTHPPPAHTRVKVP